MQEAEGEMTKKKEKEKENLPELVTSPCFWHDLCVCIYLPSPRNLLVLCLLSIEPSLRWVSLCRLAKMPRTDKQLKNVYGLIGYTVLNSKDS